MLFRTISVIHGLVFFGLLFACNTSVIAAARSNVPAWLANEDLVPKNGSHVVRVHSIFSELKRANGKLNHPSKLYIINSSGMPWAIALEDQNVILTRGAIDIIYENNDPIEFRDARMAFVLGHELKHVVEDDFRHNEIFNFTSSPTSKDITAVEGRDRRKIELNADREGLAYATVAGYDTSALFSDTGEASNFLDYWAYQTNTRLAADKQSKGMTARINELKRVYRRTVSHVEFFKYGVRLAHFGRYEQAQELFEELHKEYDSYRVLSNRGYVHLQLARAAMPAQDAFRYWYPDLLELDAGISVTRSMNHPLSPLAVLHLNYAVDLLTDGLGRASHDITTRLNLITAYLYLNKNAAARAIIEEIDDWQKQPQLLALDAMVTVNNKRQSDPWNTPTLKNIKRHVDSSDASANIIYNYSRLLSDDGRQQEAQKHWQRLVVRFSQLPRNYQVMLCREIDNSVCDSAEIKANSRKQYRENKSQLDLTVKPGDHIFSDKAYPKMKYWSDPLRLRSDVPVHVYMHGDGNSTLVVDDLVSLVTFKQHGFNRTTDLMYRYDQPNEIVKARAGEIWSYGPEWSALVSAGEVREIWVAQ